jgi:CobQ-like glutamine amidotransferase family enzyme
MTSITIVQLYPDELGVAGDRGNVMALRSRLENAGHSVEIAHHEIGAPFPTDVDVVVVGNGPLSAMRNIYDDLLSIAPTLESLASTGMPIFAYGSGAELLGHSITLLDGSTIDGLGLLPFAAARVAERSVGYVITETPFGVLVGFEDNASTWTLDSDAKPLGILEAGTGNGAGAVEGVLNGALIGTQVGGPVLPLNPLLSDVLIRSIAERRGFAYTPGEANGELERFAERAREVIVQNAKHVFSRI